MKRIQANLKEKITAQIKKEYFPMVDQENVPENALFVCFGAMSSAGALTGVAVLEAMKKLDPKKTGIFCASALAVDVPKQ